jgi:SAM-dependent methyltransferase
MRPRTRDLVSRAYRLATIPPRPEDDVEVEPGVTVPRYVQGDPQRVAREAQAYFARLPVPLDLRRRSVLEVGCGTGALSAEMARRGAARVLGVDIGMVITVARARLREEDPSLAVEFRDYGGDLHELDDELFDVIVSKDAFEHYGAIAGSPTAEQMVSDMRERLRPDGLLVIGFGPLWKAPFGGHIDVRVPWAHLLFSEETIFDEFRRVRPPGKTARTFEEGTSVNRMTFERFRRLMHGSGLKLVRMETNVSQNPLVRALDVLARLPRLDEYCTQNVYGVWRRSTARP